MTSSIQIPVKNFLRALLILFIFSVGTAWLARSFFFLSLAPELRPNVSGFVLAIPYAFLFDLAFGVYALLPFTFVYVLSPRSLLTGRRFRLWFYALSGIYLYVLIFALASELIFIQEFQARFNFIAVDYLVYTQEVLHNIWESYPIVLYISAILAGIVAILYGLRRKFRFQEQTASFWRDKTIVASLTIGLFAAAFWGVDEINLLKNKPDLLAELSKNGVHTLFAAYRNNQIDYDKFYASLDEAEAKKIWCDWKKESFDANTSFASEDGSCSYETQVTDPLPAKPLNVVIFSMESMSANFMKTYGSDKDITPNLDRLTHEGLFFSNIFATGTRTVRGLEAISLSVPPTPGQSIVRRPENNNLFSLASALRPFGYDAQFLYGGHSVFDNMREYFEGNNFEVWDKGNLTPDQIHFANAWGVCDEDLFSLAISQADAKFAAGKKFLQLIMTTSNHRPYTFPPGRIDIPSRTGRDGAVKYSDFAIGDFLKRAKSHPWFDNTIFIFVADHDASVAGGVHILPRDYKIPLIFYSPKHILPQVNPILGSQIDLAPTLMGLLHLSYKSKFFGHNLLTAKKQRAFLATYQNVSYLEGRTLLVLSPVKKIERFSNLREGDLEPALTGTLVSPTEKIATEAISFYQTASHLFQSGGMKEFAEP